MMPSETHVRKRHAGGIVWNQCFAPYSLMFDQPVILKSQEFLLAPADFGRERSVIPAVLLA